MNRYIARAANAAGIMLFTLPALAQQTIASIDPTNLVAAAGQPNAEVGRLWVTMNPFYPVASSVTWAISGTNSGGFQVSGSNPGAVLQTRGGGGTAAGSYSDFTITATIGNVSQNLSPTVTVKSGTVATCGGGGSIQNAINSAGNGGTVILQACSYTGQQATPQSNQTIIGVGRDTSIVDGVGVGNGCATPIAGPTCGAPFIGSNTSTNVQLYNFTWTHYGWNFDSVHTYDGWLLQNISANGNYGSGVNAIGRTTVRNSLIINNGNNPAFNSGEGIFYHAADSTGDNSGAMLFEGNDVGNNNTNFDNQGGIYGTIGIGPVFTRPVTIRNNYIHDNKGMQWWCDGYCNHMTVTGNTISGSSAGAAASNYEISSGPADFGFNMYFDNHGGLPSLYISSSSGTGSNFNHCDNGPCHDNFNAANVLTVHDNNVTAPSGLGSSIYAGAITIECAPRGESECGGNTSFSNNTVTFLGGSRDGFYGGGNYGGVGDDLASTHSDHNHFWMQNVNDQHFTWFNANPQTFQNGLRNAGEDANSTVQTGDGRQGATGCTHVGCTSSGIGAGGVPNLAAVVEQPFGGMARPLTSVIQAEDYDTGGSGLGYHATEGACGSPTNGDPYRADAVNIYTTTDAGGGYKIGCNQTGNYHRYTVAVATAGHYSLSLRVANIETGASYHVAIDGVTLASGIAVPNTGAYDTFATLTSGQFRVTGGQHVMQIMLDTVGPSGFGGDLNWIQGTLESALAVGSKNVDIMVTH